MKKGKKILLVIIAMFMLINTTFAATYLIKITGGLKNTVNGNQTTRNTIEGTATFDSSGHAYIDEISAVSGINASGGIRVKTFAKKMVLGIAIDTQDDFVVVYPNKSTSSTAHFSFGNGSHKVKFQWQNWTGNTSFDGVFIAYN